MSKVPPGSQRTSVNSSFPTLKNLDFSTFSDTAQKQLEGKRFSYQEAHSHQETSQKENKRDNSTRPQKMIEGPVCLNHLNTPAQFTALESSDDPMHLCQHCAIIVASKGFEIAKVAQRRMKCDGPLAGDLKQEAADVFSALKMKKNLTLEKLDLFAGKLDKKAGFLEEYFVALNEYVEREKNALLRQVVLRRRDIQSLRQQTSNFYMGFMERLKEINLESGMMGPHKASQLGKELRNIKRRNFEISFDSLKFPSLCETSTLSANKESRCKGKDAEFDFKLKCYEDHPQIRSLKLSFEEENDFTLAQETNRKL